MAGLRHAHALEASTYTSRHGPGARTAARLRSPAFEPRLPRIGSVDAVALEERGRDASEALDQG